MTNQPAHLNRASEADTRAFLERQGVTCDNTDTFDLARVLFADDEDETTGPAPQGPTDA